MKKFTRFVGALVSALLISASGFADLSDTLTQSGPKAVGEAVASAAEAIYASEATDAEKQTALSVLLDEAAATGDKDAVRYAVIAVMQAGGEDFLLLSKAAISESTISNKFAAVVERSVSSASKLYAGGSASSGGSTLSGIGGGAGGGTTDADNVFSSSITTTVDELVSGDINDEDSEATDT